MQPSRSLKACLLCALVAVSPVVRPGSVRAVAAQRSVADRDDAVVLVLPTRRTPTAPPAAPPALPPGAERVAPVTLETLIRRQPAAGRVQTLRQTITRTSDRVHVAASDGREWLFERNVRDPRRVFGSLIEHASRAIVVYDESDLRNMLGLRGWANVLALGFDLDLLSGLEPTTQMRTISGIRFARYATERKDAVIPEVWWSVDQIFPSGFVTADGSGSTRFSVERVRVGVDAGVLRAPISRFPTYHVFDLADWLERH